MGKSQKCRVVEPQNEWVVVMKKNSFKYYNKLHKFNEAEKKWFLSRRDRYIWTERNCLYGPLGNQKSWDSEQDQILQKDPGFQKKEDLFNFSEIRGME